MNNSALHTVHEANRGAYQDNLPTYIRVRIELAPLGDVGRSRAFERLIYMPNAIDSHVPLPDVMDVDNSDEERVQITRDQVLDPTVTWRPREKWFAPEGEDIRRRAR